MLETSNVSCQDFRIEKFCHWYFLQDGKLWLWFKMKGFDLKASYWLKILCFHPILKQQEYPYYGNHWSFITIMHEIFFLCHFLLLLMFFSLSFSVFNQNVCIEFFYPFIHMMARRKLQYIRLFFSPYFDVGFSLFFSVSNQNASLILSLSFYPNTGKTRVP